MFWKIGASIFICLFVSGGEQFLNSPVRVKNSTLSLAQQKTILLWNQKQNGQNIKILSAWSTERLTQKLENIKNQNRRLFLEETVSAPKRDLKFRLSQETLHESEPHL